MTHCFVGFDGFIDEIIRPVATRESSSSYTTFSSMRTFGERLLESEGKSCNIEFVVQEKKIGGNGPIMANALLQLRNKITFAGTIGKPDPLFKTFTQKCEDFFSLGNCGHSEALEFPDGKIILGKLEPLQKLTHTQILKIIGESHFLEILERSTLFVSANWTMLPMTNALWLYLIDSIVPKLSKKKRYLFIDLADPAKRSDVDLTEALQLLKELNQTFDVILSLNQAEAARLIKTCHLESSLSIKDLTQTLFNHLNLSCIVIHSSKFTSGAIKGSLETHLPFFNDNPKITTGAGDNFNAGFCNAILHGQSLYEALVQGNGTAGFYIREGRSPNVEELAIFLRTWDNIKV